LKIRGIVVNIDETFDSILGKCQVELINMSEWVNVS